MDGVSLVETKTLQTLIAEMQDMKDFVAKTAAALQDATKPYMTAQEVMDLTGFGHNWLNQNMKDIGYSKIGGAVRFKRKDVEAFIEANYFKTKSPRRKIA